MTTPTTWQRIRLKYLYRSSGAANHPREQVLSVYRDYGVIPKTSRSDNFNKTPENIDRYLLVRPGDLVVNRMKAWQGSLGVSEHRGIVSGDYEVLRPLVEDLEGRFMHYLLRSSHMIGEYRVRSTGIRPSQWRLYWDQMGDLAVDLPEAQEQRAIADYLDREVAELDALVGAQQRFIALLQKRRTALITHAIPKPGSSEWPADKLGRRSVITNGATPRREEPRYWADGNFPWLNSSVVNQDAVTESDQLITQDALQECHLPITEPGDILVALTGQGKTRGMSTLVQLRAAINQHLACVHADRTRWDTHYLLWSLTSSYNDLRRGSETNGATKGGLTVDALKRHVLVMPPLDQQRRIAVYLGKHTAQINLLLAKAQENVELVKKRKAALITAVVTGQKRLPSVAQEVA